MQKTVNEGELGVLRRKGVIVKELPAGRHRYFPLLRSERLSIINAKPVTYTSSTQEYTTTDNLVVRFFVRASVQVSDASALLKTTEYDTISDLIQNTVSDIARAYVATCTLDELLANDTTIDTVIQKEAGKVLNDYGMTVLSVSPISILIPRSLKAAFEAKISAQKKAEADLEEARGRTATLRHLANAADLVEKRPVLLQLLLGQKARNVQFTFDKTDHKNK